jgi:hypothetical protein
VNHEQRVRRPPLAVCTIAARDPIALLEASNEGRLPNLIHIRYGRMVRNRSLSMAVQPLSWHMTCPACRGRTRSCNWEAMGIWPTSACLQAPSGASCSGRTISTKRCPGLSTGCAPARCILRDRRREPGFGARGQRIATIAAKFALSQTAHHAMCRVASLHRTHPESGYDVMRHCTPFPALAVRRFLRNVTTPT